MRPVAVVGNLSCDRVDGTPPRPGGAPFYAARALRILGCPSRVVTKCAPEDRRLLVTPLVAYGIPVVWRPAARTTSFVIRNEGQHRTMEIASLGTPWTLDDIRSWVGDGLGGAEWVHAGALSRDEFPSETLRALARGRRLSLDGQALVRAEQTGPLHLDTSFDREILRHVRVLKLSEEEALLVAGALDEAHLAALGVPEVVVTLGARGCLVLDRGRLERITTHVRAGVDPTGAGDAFAASYVAARSSGHAPRAAARRANALVAGLLGGRMR